mgnify:CR=1 FL=1|tara:strand:+ start:346 stop:801 length:456 start_codon:yes stop_codon:yes gene_type:complete
MYRYNYSYGDSSSIGKVASPLAAASSEKVLAARKELYSQPSPTQQYEAALAALSERDREICKTQVNQGGREKFEQTLKTAMIIGIPLGIGIGWVGGLLLSLPFKDPTTKRNIKIAGAVVYPIIANIRAYMAIQKMKAIKCPTPPTGVSENG